MTGVFIFGLSVVRALAEIAGWSFLAQGVLFFIAGNSRDSNVIYRFLKTVTRPVVFASRAVLPSAIADRWIPIVAFLLLFCLWIAIAYIRLQIYQSNGLACS